jgi:hypothetical protein
MADFWWRAGSWVNLVLLRFAATEARGVHVDYLEDLSAGLVALGLPFSQPVVVVVGGAGGLKATELQRLQGLFGGGLVPILEERGAVAVDGGTDVGVMRLLGQGRALLSGAFPLVGVVAEGTVRLPGEAYPQDGAELEPHHTHFVIVPGDEWGAEAPWIARTATALAKEAPSVTVLVNGGEIAYADAERSVDAGRPVVVVAGSGRTADQLDAALRGQPADNRARALVASGLVSSVPADQAAVRDAVASALARKPG